MIDGFSFIRYVLLNEGRSRLGCGAGLTITFFTGDVSECGVPGRAADDSSKSIDCGRTLLFFLESAALIPDSFAGLLGNLVSGTLLSLTSTLADCLGFDSEPSPIMASSPCSDVVGVVSLVFDPESLDQNAHVDPADGWLVGAGAEGVDGADGADGGASSMATSLLGFCTTDCTGSWFDVPWTLSLGEVGVVYDQSPNQLDCLGFGGSVFGSTFGGSGFGGSVGGTIVSTT